ncbi:MAG: hypothetical protein ACE5LU_13565 [Anaerolineae bacterium]
MAAPALQVSPGAVYIVWWISLLIGGVVIVVVAYLLRQIEQTARSINTVVGDIWTTGQHIANNTIHIPQLIATNRIVDDIHTTASGILQAAAAIEQHAEGCPGCPQCVLGNPGHPAI